MSTFLAYVFASYFFNSYFARTKIHLVAGVTFQTPAFSKLCVGALVEESLPRFDSRTHHEVSFHDAGWLISALILNHFGITTLTWNPV